MASRISRKVCTLGRPGALGTGRWGSIQDHSASDKSVWYALLMLGTLPSHLLKAPFRTVSEGEFSEVRFNGVLGSSFAESCIKPPARGVRMASVSRCAAWDGTTYCGAV